MNNKTLPRFSLLAANLSKASYGGEDEVREVAKSHNPHGSCDVFRVSGPMTSADAFVVVFSFPNGITRLICVVVKGTKELEDFVQDIKIEKKGGLHQGFNAQAIEIKDRVFKIINRFDEFGETTVLFTGHSLGGAVATILSAKQYDSLVITFGAPRIGNAEWVDKMNNLVYRFVHESDLVPKLPLLIFGYRHPFSHEYYIYGNGKIRRGVPWLVKLKDALMNITLDGVPDGLADHDMDLYNEAIVAYVEKGLGNGSD